MKANILILAILVFPGIAFAQKNFVDQNYIDVQGHAVVKVVPDQIYLRIQISEKQKNRMDLEAKEREMIARLKDIGIDVAKELVIKDMASNFRSKILSDDNIIISKVYLLLVHDAKTANKVISDMETLEISNIKVDHLDHTKLADYRKECSVKAMMAAKSKAESLAQAIGQSIGRALYVEEIQLPVMYGDANASYNYAYKAEASTSPDWFVTDLDFDEIKIDYTIAAKFELNNSGLVEVRLGAGQQMFGTFFYFFAFNTLLKV